MAGKAEIEEAVKKRLSRGLFEHCKRVSQIAAELAAANKEDTGKAEIAGLLHDYARNLSREELLAAARKLNMPLNKAEIHEPYLLHAAVGAEIAREDFDIKDRQVIESIKAHTFGKKDMTKFDKIIYLADTLDPGRGNKDSQKQIDEAKADIEKVFSEIYAGQLEYLIKNKKVIHPVSMDVWNELVQNNRYGREHEE